ncbi:SDR family oxidoreductase [Cohnella zeiphila]|uniref:SDR family oxidoreductase n=1 Tax=Cohnella zeiphila TaxID=2761120 RepID=A0A7X0SQA2_9BACL|nr:SDR family oxidoreductase [Cohnella zeiphila]MBB6734180.1 SDR family oxidoreductase [Cohnella zeiphila]
MANNANERAVLITGANGGIGMELARAMTGRGWRVFAGVRDLERGAMLKKTIAGKIVPIRLDITSPDSVQAAAREIAASLGAGGLDGLVNNAGCIVKGPLELIPPDEFKRQFDINVFGQIAVTQAMLPLLRRNRGRIVNIGATSGKLAFPYFGAVSASKHALEAITDALRVEVKPWGVSVSLIQPGAIQTSIFEKANAEYDRSLSGIPADKRALYEEAMAAFDSAMAKQSASPASVVADAVVHALTSAKPRTRYAAGRVARMIVMLGRRSDRLRDWLLIRMLGLSKLMRETR